MKIKKFIARMLVVPFMLIALSMPVAVGHVQALVACNPLVHFPCTGGGIVCVDKHGHVRHFNGRIHDGWHCVAI